MNKVIKRLLCLLVIVLLAGCNNPNFETGKGPRLIVNGKELDVYTEHYTVTENYAIIPVEAFMDSLGAESEKDSPYNTYRRSCVLFMGQRYVIDEENHLFMTEYDYSNLLQKLNQEGKELSKYTTKGEGLLSGEEYTLDNPKYPYYLSWNGLFVDHQTLMKAFQESGISILIDFDYDSQMIIVTAHNIE